MPYYPPLYWEDDVERHEPQRSWFERLFASEVSAAEQHLTNQIARRGPIPSWAWCDDPERETLAREIGAIIADVLQWPNANFIPEDPLKYVLYVVGGEDLEYTEIAIRVENSLGCEFLDEDFDELFQCTYGEFIDRILARTPSFREIFGRMTPYAVHGRSSLGAKNCPSLTTFIDLREFVKQPRFHKRANKFGLDSPIRRAIPSSVRPALHWYLCQRFNLATSPFALDPNRDGIALGLTATAISTMPFILISAIAELEFTGTSGGVWALPVFIAAIGLGITALPAVRYLLSRIAQLPGERRVKTVRDLVKWIVRERSGVTS